MENQAIILFDGVCNFCNDAVQFIIKRDPKAYFKFAPLQSEEGKALLAKHGMPIDEMDTIVLVENGKAYSYSTAALRIARRLSGLWALFYVFIIIPPFLRNPVYRFIGRNRYKWFGKKESCMMPTPEIRSRFLA